MQPLSFRDEQIPNIDLPAVWQHNSLILIFRHRSKTRPGAAPGTNRPASRPAANPGRRDKDDQTNADRS